MSLGNYADEQRLNPLDVVERLAAGKDWSFERASDDEMNRSPPVKGSFWLSSMLSDALVCCCGRNRVLPSGCNTGMIDRL